MLECMERSHGEEAVEGAFADVEAREVREKVVAHEKGHEHEVVDHALQVHGNLCAHATTGGVGWQPPVAVGAFGQVQISWSTKRGREGHGATVRVAPKFSKRPHVQPC